MTNPCLILETNAVKVCVEKHLGGVLASTTGSGVGVAKCQAGRETLALRIALTIASLYLFLSQQHRYNI